MTDFEQFGENIRERPKVGNSLGLVPYDFPSIDQAYLDSKFKRTNARKLIEQAIPKETIAHDIPLANKKGIMDRIMDSFRLR